MIIRKMYDKVKTVTTGSDGKNCKVQQQFKEKVDIYNVLQKHTRGIPENITRKTPIFADVSQPIDPFQNEINIDTLKKKQTEQEKAIDEKREMIETEKHEKRSKAIQEKKEKEKNEKTEKNTSTVPSGTKTSADSKT